MESVKVVVPIYKESLSELETKILANNLTVLKAHTFVLLVPEGMDLTWYEKSFDISKCEILRVTPDWLGRKNGIEGYNQMMLSSKFYRLFEDVDYMLICQTDAYIFRDELNDWCAKGYDYIGAPWPRRKVYDLPLLKQYMQLRKWIIKDHYIRQNLFNKVGNGGLSLRKVQSFINAAESYKDEIIRRRSRTKTHLSHEDVIWALLPKEFRYPEFDEALRFSVDVKPALCFEMLGETLPFGCHGITRANVYEFWQDKLKL